MSPRTCSSCNALVRDRKRITCPQCDAFLPRHRSKLAIWAASALTLLALALFVLIRFGARSGTFQEEDRLTKVGLIVLGVGSLFWLLRLIRGKH